MTYVIGIDGGGSKTRGILLSKDGTIHRDISLGPTNYHTIGIEATEKTLSDLINTLCESITPDALAHIYLGLAGADIDVDFKRLGDVVSKITHRPFTIANDIWCAFKASSTENWGAVSIYGTGANAAAVAKNGEVFGLRALGHLLGGGGGGYDIACEALHFGFRSEEGTYIKTALEFKIPEIFGKRIMSDLVPLMHPTFQFTEKHLALITPLVFKLAAGGDSVASEILEKYGRLQGQMLAGVIKRAGLTQGPVPVVIGGSVYKGESPILIDAMMAEVKRVSPAAHVVWPKSPPVLGALLYAQEKAGWEMHRPEI